MIKTKQEIKVDIIGLKEKLNFYKDKQKQIIELPYKDDYMSSIII